MSLVRWTIPPQCIIYDNACHAERYCLSREAAFFANVVWRIDRIHQPGHVKCSLAYSLDLYISDDMIQYVNSQVEEEYIVCAKLECMT